MRALHPLEEGKHAAESGMDLKAYAAASGKKYATVIDKAQAWEVLTSWDIPTDLPTEWMHYRYIHAAPQWLWPALVEWAPRARVGGGFWDLFLGNKRRGLPARAWAALLRQVNRLVAGGCNGW